MNVPSRADELSDLLDITLAAILVLDERITALEKIHPSNAFTHVHHRQLIEHDPRESDELHKMRDAAIWGGKPLGHNEHRD